ncbi:tRNA preQ1(34) S-adenosylmethionine ribosyltransferase-isomerase QueA [bacterium]|nr:tRNA preQ1(34) S-adenosylmethionine ribosyltransferase-isomerase QueA [bacterium]
MKTKDFYFDLPKDLIAQNPVSPRDSSKLMVLNRSNKSIEHHFFYELPKLLPRNSILVLNDTKVYAGRLYVTIDNKKGELLVLKKRSNDVWKCMVKPGKRFSVGKDFIIEGKEEELNASVQNINEDGTREIKFNLNTELLDWIENNGYPPFPPYIKHTQASFQDYQTTYAKDIGSIAAPTAGLHFTDRVFNELKKKNIEILTLTLHVGRGTFLPVKVDNIEDHKMHSEWYMLSKENAEKLNMAKRQNKEIIAVGTTSVRTLESNFKNGLFHPETTNTNIFIYPGYNYKAIDGIITNFHLPESTLIMLISAFAEKKFIFKAYDEAIKNKYRFYSFGDSMMIL